MPELWRQSRRDAGAAPTIGRIGSRPSPGANLNKPAGQRRKYDSPLRQQRAAETRERIISAGAELIHGYPIWNWAALTVRAVAKRARVHERTVYRHFATERDLRDAVLGRLQQEAGVRVEVGLQLKDVAELTARILEYASSFPIEPRTPRDPTVAAANERQREALVAAVAPLTKKWSAVDRSIAAAMFDVLWSPVSYERLATDWELDPKNAIRGIRWVIELIEDAIRAGRKPRA